MTLLTVLQTLGFRAKPFLFQPGEREVAMPVASSEMVLVAGADLVQVKTNAVVVYNRQLGASPGLIVVTPGGKVGALILSLMERYGDKK